MNEKMIKKMITNCLTDYFSVPEAIPLTESEYRFLITNVKEKISAYSEEALYVVIQDVVYDYITQ